MQKIKLIYDGECPFCQTYARFVKLRDVSGGFELVNARESGHEAVKEAIKRGYNLDDGMVAIVNGQYYHGEEALHVLALMSSRSGIFNRLNYCLFSSKTLSALFYPVFRFGRNVALRIKGVRKIHS